MMIEKLNYDYAECRDLVKNAPRNDIEFKDAQEYYFKRVIAVDGGLTYYYLDGVLTPYPTEKFKSEKMRGFDNKFKKVLEENVCDYREVLEIEDYEVDHKKRKVNTLGRVYAKTLEHIKVGQKGKDYVEYVKSFLFEIISRRDQKYYDYLLKHISSVVQLKKLDICLSFITRSQGVGKSSVAELIMAILGDKLTMRAKPEDIDTNNLGTYGKVFILFEELGGLSDNEYKRLIENLKNMVTAKKTTFKDKYIRGKQLEIISNFMVTSNFAVSLGDDSRRELNKLISTAWECKTENWDKLYNFCDENIKALYDFFLSVDITGFKAQTEAKKIKQDDHTSALKSIECMCDVWKMLKEEYALLKIDAKIRQSDLYEKYVELIFPKKPVKLSKFDELIMELECCEKRTSTGNKMFYYIDGKALYDKFKLKNLILKEEENNGEVQKHKEVDLVRENEELKKRILELENKLNEQPKKEKKEKKEEVKPKPQLREGETIIKVKAFKK